MKGEVHCQHCGAPYPADTTWPGGRTCSSCGKTTWLNPLPAANILVPVQGGGVIVVKRGQHLHGAGKWATPGGFIERHETWQVAALRELFEELGIISDMQQKELGDQPEEMRKLVEHLAAKHLGINTLDLRLYAGLNQPPHPLAIFGLVPCVTPLERLPFSPNSEATECRVVTRPEDLAFGVQTKAVTQFLTKHWTGDVGAFDLFIDTFPHLLPEPA